VQDLVCLRQGDACERGLFGWQLIWLWFLSMTCWPNRSKYKFGSVWGCYYLVRQAGHSPSMHVVQGYDDSIGLEYYAEISLAPMVKGLVQQV